jgi:uncharacterized membrane protein
MEVAEFVLRWLHFLAGITWIGVLYYFNFIQTPFFGTELGGTAKGAMTRALVPNALWWFRWGAMFTFITGWLMLFMKLHGGVDLTSGYMTRILTGGVMGTLMWANVWFVIWPAQQIVIENANNVAGGAEPNPAAAAAGGKAGMASRTNTLFSIPMLFFMAAATHLPSLARGADLGNGVQIYWIAALIVMLLAEINGLIGPGAASQKPLTTVSGTIHAGLALTAVLMVAQIALI